MSLFIVPLTNKVMGNERYNFEDVSLISKENSLINFVENGEFKESDILFIHDSRFNDTIWNLFYWTHCFLYSDNQEFIWVCDKVKRDNISTISTYFQVSNWAQLRLKNNSNLNNVIKFAEEQYGKPFDTMSLYLVTKQIDPPLDHFGYGYYCTELIWAAYMEGVDVNLDPNRIGWINPLEIFNNEILQKVHVEKEISRISTIRTAEANTLLNTIPHKIINLLLSNNFTLISHFFSIWYVNLGKYLAIM